VAGRFEIWTAASGDAQSMYPNDINSRFVIANNGDIGIGTVTPATKLDVNGAVTIEAGPSGYAVCYTSAHALGHCTSVVAAGGTCICAAN